MSISFKSYQPRTLWAGPVAQKGVTGEADPIPPVTNWSLLICAGSHRQIDVRFLRTVRFRRLYLISAIDTLRI